MICYGFMCTKVSRVLHEMMPELKKDKWLLMKTISSSQQQKETIHLSLWKLVQVFIRICFNDEQTMTYCYTDIFCLGRWAKTKQERKVAQIPVTGASMSIIVFSCLNKDAPLLIIFKATSSCSLPSKIKCCLRTSGLGLSLLSNTSLSVSR